MPTTDKTPLWPSLTGSLVFDEEQLESLLERVLVDIELHLDPRVGMESSMGALGRWGPQGRSPTLQEPD